MRCTARPGQQPHHSQVCSGCKKHLLVLSALNTSAALTLWTIHHSLGSTHRAAANVYLGYAGPTLCVLSRTWCSTVAALVLDGKASYPQCTGPDPTAAGPCVSHRRKPGNLLSLPLLWMAMRPATTTPRPTTAATTAPAVPDEPLVSRLLPCTYCLGCRSTHNGLKSSAKITA